MEEEKDCVKSMTNLSKTEEEFFDTLVTQRVGDARAKTDAYEQFQKVVSKYQEQPQILDPVLEKVVSALAQQLLQGIYDCIDDSNNLIKTESDDKLDVVVLVSRYLWKLSSVRGYKTILRFMPNDVDCIDPVFSMLKMLTEKETDHRFHGGKNWWECSYVCLMWLSQLALVPFHFSVIDPISQTLDPENQAVDGDSERIVDQMIRVFKQHLKSSCSTREMAAVALGRVLTRPDMEEALQKYATWCLSTLSSFCQSDTDASKMKQTSVSWFLVPGIIQSLATIFKLGRGNCVAVIATDSLQFAVTLFQMDEYSSNSLIRKLCVKMAQRSILSSLAGAYMRGDNSLIDDPAMAEICETAIDLLLQGLEDKDTVVRWSAAKGVGRVSSRLPEDFSTQILDTVLEIFASPAASEHGWHGGCLALAELTRRNLLPCKKIDHVIPIVQEGLQFEIRKGFTSVGTNVRDASAYVCWALARAHDRDLLRPAVEELSPYLMTTACYDREINCRRAAAAAFQECVGRLGTFSYGIEILTSADYFTVSLRNTAFLDVAPHVAIYPGYHEPFAHHLLHKKLVHWEKSLRELAAKAISKLVFIDAQYHASISLPELLVRCRSVGLEERHGALSGVAELLPALRTQLHHDSWIPKDVEESISCIIPDIVSLELTKGKGGEMIRNAACRLIKALAITRICLNSTQLHCIYAFLRENLKHPSEEIQVLAASSLSEFLGVFLEQMEGDTNCTIQRDKVVDSLLEELHPHMNVESRRGSALALGELSNSLFSGANTAVRIVSALCKASRPEEQFAFRDIVTRVNALKSISRVISKVRVNDLTDAEKLSLMEMAVQAMNDALDDYSTDNRGDIGSWARDAAMQSTSTTLHVIKKNELLHQMEPLIKRLIYRISRQTVERISKIRQHAGDTLYSCTFIAEHVGSKKMWEVVRRMKSVDYVEGRNIQYMAHSMCSDLELQFQIIEGIVYSIGGLDANTKDLASHALKSTLDRLNDNGNDVENFLSVFVKTWQLHQKSNRLSAPFLQTVDVIFNHEACINNIRFLKQSINLITQETRDCKDVGKLCFAANALATLVGSGGWEGRQEALPILIALIGNKYPKVRRVAAEQLYTALLLWEEDDTAEGMALDAAENILCETCWDGPATEVRPARIRLAESLNVCLQQ